MLFSLPTLPPRSAFLTFFLVICCMEQLVEYLWYLEGAKYHQIGKKC
jgi:hypothetical protein